MTTTRGRWFPASVRVPGGEVYRRVYVVAAEGGERRGLHIFRRPSERADWWSDIDWSSTPKLPTGRQARNGMSIALVTGEIAVVTATQGCKCGAMGRWAGPSWAGTVSAA